MERRKTDVFHDVMCLTTTIIMEEMRIKKNKILFKCFSTQQMLGRNEHFFATLIKILVYKYVIYHTIVF